MNESIASFCAEAYSFLLPLFELGTVIVVFVLLPLALFKSTRGAVGTIMYGASWFFGITTWFLGATITFATWGWVGLLIGLFMAGVGVVPIGILAAFISLKSSEFGFSLILMCVVVFATRLGGIALMHRAAVHQAGGEPSGA